VGLPSRAAQLLGDIRMGRRLFGTRKDLPGTAGWPQLPGALQRVEAITASAITRASEASPPDDELLERIAAFRSAVADSLYDVSKDYQMLCNLTHADLTACDEIIAELRRRLAGNIHYEVLAKLDDVHAHVAAHIGGK
jgi:hypothetical protein